MAKRSRTALMLTALMAGGREAPTAATRDDIDAMLKARQTIQQSFREGLERLKWWDAIGKMTEDWAMENRLLHLEKMAFADLVEAYSELKAADFGYERGYLSIRQVAKAYFGEHLYPYVEEGINNYLQKTSRTAWIERDG